MTLPKMMVKRVSGTDGHELVGFIPARVEAEADESEGWTVGVLILLSAVTLAVMTAWAVWGNP